MDQANPYAAKRKALSEKFMPGGVATNGPAGVGGVHHLVFISSDLGATVQFYSDILGMRLVKVIQNRDDPTSTHIFLDMGGGNMLAFFDFPEHGDAPVQRGIGAMHHVALKATPDQLAAVIEKLEARSIAHDLHGTPEAGAVYFRDPDNVLLEVNSREY